MRYIVPFCVLVLLGCTRSQRETGLTGDPSQTNHSQTASIAKEKTVLGVEAVTNKAVKFGDLPDQSQIKVLVCDYVIRKTLSDHTSVVFVVLDDTERHALASRLPGFKLLPTPHTEATEDAGSRVDKQSKEIGVELEVSAVEINGRQARALASWGDFTSRVFELEKTDEWRIRKMGHIRYVDYYPAK